MVSKLLKFRNITEVVLLLPLPLPGYKDDSRKHFHNSIVLVKITELQHNRKLF